MRGSDDRVELDRVADFEAVNARRQVLMDLLPEREVMIPFGVRGERVGVEMVGCIHTAIWVGIFMPSATASRPLMHM